MHFNSFWCKKLGAPALSQERKGVEPLWIHLLVGAAVLIFWVLRNL